MIEAMENALDALKEYYKDDAPVVYLLQHAIVEAKLMKAENEQMKAELIKTKVEYEKEIIALKILFEEVNDEL
jgi:hypothetical protein